MMATTHVFVGLAAVVPIAYVAPEFTVSLAVGAIVGGLAPDFDLVLEHRRSFHFPIAGAIPASVAAVLAILLTSPFAVALAAATVAAWLHAASDALGGGPEMDPWTDPSDRAVYDHVRKRWLRPRRWIRYDGAPEDAALAVALAVPAVFVYDGWLTAVILGAVVLSIVYALLRRRLVAWTPDWLE